MSVKRASLSGDLQATADDDPEYLIAYDVERRKVGCVLIQAALGGTVPRDIYLDYFGDTAGWTVDATGCVVYPIRRSQLPVLAIRTNTDHDH